MSVLLALCSSLLWGTSDFLGGTASRRLAASVVVGSSQAIALLGLLPLVLLYGSRPEHPWAGPAAGLAGMVGLAAFYAALAGGTMGVVAPIASLGALLPVVVGVARGEQPSLLQVIGIVVAIIGVVLASGPELSGQASARPLVLASVAAVGFGLVTVLLAEGSKGPSGAVLDSLMIMRVTSVSALGLGYVVASRRGFRSGVRPADLGLLAAIGLGDVGANAAFAVASRGGLLSVVSVLSSLYPVVTVLLARQLQGERLRPIQGAGVLGAVAGVALLSLG